VLHDSGGAAIDAARRETGRGGTTGRQEVSDLGK
jgi:hypothetical protein